MRIELLESLDEKQKHWFAEWLESFASSSTISSIKFARYLAEIFTALAAHGHCVIVGRGASVVLPEMTTLRVRVVAPLPIRIKRMQEKFGITKDEAARRVKEFETARAVFIRSHFQKDVADDHCYDVVLNSGRLSTTQCADLIIAALQELENAGGQQASSKTASM